MMPADWITRDARAEMEARKPISPQANDLRIIKWGVLAMAAMSLLGGAYFAWGVYEANQIADHMEAMSRASRILDIYRNAE